MVPKTLIAAGFKRIFQDGECLMTIECTLAAAPGAEQAWLRQKLPAAHMPPLQRLLSESTLVRDSPDPPVSQGWKNLPATWLTASPIASRHAEQREDAVDAQPAAAEQLSDTQEQRSQDVGVAIEEAQPDADRTVAADVRGRSSGPSSCLLAHWPTKCSHRRCQHACMTLRNIWEYTSEICEVMMIHGLPRLQMRSRTLLRQRQPYSKAA